MWEWLWAMSALYKLPLKKRKEEKPSCSGGKLTSKLSWVPQVNLDFVVFWLPKGLCVYFVTTEVICSPATTLLSRCRSLSAVNTCPKGWESIQAVPDTRQMWELERLLVQPACLSTLCKLASCLHFFPFLPTNASLNTSLCISKMVPSLIVFWAPTAFSIQKCTLSSVSAPSSLACFSVSASAEIEQFPSFIYIYILKVYIDSSCGPTSFLFSRLYL